MAVAKNNNRLYQVIGAAVLLLVLAGTYAYAGLGVMNPAVKACKNYCPLANAEYYSVDDGECHCVSTDQQLDLQNNRMINVRRVLNAGRVKGVEIISPIPQEIQKQIVQQIQQQQAIQQQAQ